MRLRTEKKIEFLKNEFPDFEIVELWEHDWDNFCRENSLNFENPKKTLNIRHALYGGRTNALTLYHKCQQNEKFFYYDFISLYPAV